MIRPGAGNFADFHRSAAILEQVDTRPSRCAFHREFIAVAIARLALLQMRSPYLAISLVLV